MSTEKKYIRLILMLLFAVLVVVPCTIKQNLKTNIGIPVVEHANNIKISSTLCTTASATSNQNINKQQVKNDDSLNKQFISHFTTIAFRNTQEKSVNHSSLKTSQSTSTPLYIQLQVLII